METFNIQIFILQLIVMTILFAVIYNLIKILRAIKLEKKINIYSIDSIDDEYESIFDKIHIIHKKTIKKLSRLLSKSNIIKKRSKKYIQYIKDEDDNAIDYISNKILVIFTLLIIVVIFDVFQFRSVSFIQILIITIIGYFSIDIYLYINNVISKKHISDDMLKAVIIMNSAFKSGRTVMQAIEIVKNELSGEIRDEFAKMHTDLSFGLSIEETFTRFSKRINNDDAKYIASSLMVLNKTGGDITKIFSSIERSFFTRRKLKNELKSLTSSASLMFKALSIAPIIIFLIVFALDPSYFAPLINTTIGLIVSSLILIIYIGYILFIKRIMKVDI